MPSWSLHQRKAVADVEKVWRQAARTLEGMGLADEKRLKRLPLFLLERRRRRGHMSKVYRVTESVEKLKYLPAPPALQRVAF